MLKRAEELGGGATFSALRKASVAGWGTVRRRGKKAVLSHVG
jgi:hypothetical protein